MHFHPALSDAWCDVTSRVANVARPGVGEDMYNWHRTPGGGNWRRPTICDPVVDTHGVHTRINRSRSFDATTLKFWAELRAPCTSLGNEKRNPKDRQETTLRHRDHRKICELQVGCTRVGGEDIYLQPAMLNVDDTLFDLDQVVVPEGHMIGVRFRF